MLKKFLAKRAENFDFKNGTLVIDANNEELSLLPSNVKDILISRNNNSIVLTFGFDKVTIHFKSEEKKEYFFSEFKKFFSREEFQRLKAGLIRKTIIWSFLVVPLTIYVYLNHFERFNVIAYFLAGMFFYSIIFMYFHIKELDKFFRCTYIINQKAFRVNK